MAKIPDPKPGRVIRYEYLWRRQALEGRDVAEKDRPACIVLAVRQERGDTRVMILPITHAAPTADQKAVEIPVKVKEHLGLDTERSWIVVSEANIDTWPSPDLREVPGRRGETEYGLLPLRLLNMLRAAVLSAVEAKRMSATDREAHDPAASPDLDAFVRDAAPPAS